MAHSLPDLGVFRPSKKIITKRGPFGPLSSINNIDIMRALTTDQIRLLRSLSLLEPMRFYFHFTSKDWTVPVDEIAEHKELESWSINGAYVVRCHMEFSMAGFHLDVRFVDGTYLTVHSKDEADEIDGFIDTPTKEVDPNWPTIRKKSSHVSIVPSKFWSRVDAGETVIRAIRDELTNILQNS